MYTEPQRVIVIGDLHGDFDAFKMCLRLARVINEREEWLDNQTAVVQLGDTLDGKRPGVSIYSEYRNHGGEREIIDMVNNFRRAGKNITLLIGNHELYFNYYDLEGYNKNIKKNFVKKSDDEERRYEYYRRGGKYARVIADNRKLIHKIGKLLFIHGSLTDSMIQHGKNGDKVDIDKINETTSDWLRNSVAVTPKFLEYDDKDNPTLSRKYGNGMGYSRCRELNKQLRMFDAEYLFIGHTPFEEVSAKCDNSLFRADVMLSRAFGKQLNSKKQVIEVLDPYENPKISILSKETLSKRES